jgi:ribosomal protein S18 acetylase RimI-like enzyme
VHTEFRLADTRRELKSLVAFDRKVFSAADSFEPHMWRNYMAFWMLVQGKKIGCCAFEENVDFSEDSSNEETNAPLRRSLYIATTGILRDYQGKGFGSLMKAWQISYARHYGFTRLVTNMRKSNASIIGLSKKYGFKRLRIVSRYYSDGEAALVMERRL